jgi:hypothetical protein
MMRSNFASLTLVVFCFILNATFVFAVCAAEPRVFLLNGARLEKVRQRSERGDTDFAPALEALRGDAEKSLSAGPFSVVNKDATPPSGDKHDYMSLAPYWWPNRDTPDGLPYVHRDGERNPEIYKTPNRRDLGEFTDTLETLSLGYYFTGEERFAERATLLLRTWFIDPQTRMNPNFQYAQAIRGINTGRGLGLIESRLFTKVVDAVGLLANSKSWTSDDQRAIESWFSQYLQWMQSSDNGRAESRAENNHGTYYDVQIATFALFLGNRQLAIDVLEAAKTKRIAFQIEPDGRQPLELVRTKAWSYSLGNLHGLMSLARLGEHVDVDLWNYRSADGRSIRAALDYLLPFGVGDKEWPHQQIGGFDPKGIESVLRACAGKYRDTEFQSTLSSIRPVAAESRLRLLQPSIN